MTLVPSGERIDPPADCTAAAKLTVSPSYGANVPAYPYSPYLGATVSGELLQLSPGPGRLLARLGQDVLAVVEEIGVAVVGHGVQPALVHGGGDGGLEELAQRELVLRQGDDPAVRREFRGPDDVHVDDVVLVALSLQVRDQLGQLVVGRLGEQEQGDLLVRVELVPPSDHALQPARVVFADGQGDRADPVGRRRRSGPRSPACRAPRGQQEPCSDHCDPAQRTPHAGLLENPTTM